MSDGLQGVRVKAAVAFLHDLTMAVLAFILALYLREGAQGLVRLERDLLLSLGVYTLCCAGVFLLGGLYRGIWRYASLNDLVAIVRAVSIALALFLLISFMMTRLEAYPRSALATNWFVLCTLLAGPRLFYQLLKYRSTEHLMERDAHLRVPVLLVGAGDEADEFIRNAARDRHAPYEVVGLVDLKGKRVGRSIRNVPVLGRLDELERVVAAAVRRSGRRPQPRVLPRPLGREALT
ncbi:MAG: polysaccharide biosynthesis protein, partial [Tistlia sp.]